MATTGFSYAPDVTLLLLPPTATGRVRFSRKAYHRLVDIDILTPDSRVELIDGEILMMSPIGPLQGSIISRLNSFFVRRLPDSLDCRIRLPIVAGDHSEPLPDVAIVRHHDDDYRREHPSPADVILLIEVAESSLKRDLGKKLRLYAKSGIPEYWMVDVERETVIVHVNPIGTSYQGSVEFTAGTSIAPTVVPECQLDLGWLFA